VRKEKRGPICVVAGRGGGGRREAIFNRPPSGGRKRGEKKKKKQPAEKKKEKPDGVGVFIKKEERKKGNNLASSFPGFGREGGAKGKKSPPPTPGKGKSPTLDDAARRGGKNVRKKREKHISGRGGKSIQKEGFGGKRKGASSSHGMRKRVAHSGFLFWFRRKGLGKRGWRSFAPG